MTLASPPRVRPAYAIRLAIGATSRSMLMMPVRDLKHG